MAGNRKWTPQDDEDLLQLAESGYRSETVAQVLGRTSSAVQKRLAQLRRTACDPPGMDALSIPGVSEDASTA